jgi:general secretion pathway protein I
MSRGRARGFTLVEVLVALMVVAIGLAALMVAVSGTARNSAYLRDKTLAQWIALNHLTEVRLGLNKAGSATDTSTLDFAGRKWHYDTRYFATSFQSMKRIVVRVYAGDAKAKGNPLAESTGYLGTALAAPGSSNVDWTVGSNAATLNQSSAGTTTTPATGAAVANPSGGTSTTPGTGTTGTTPPTTTPESTPQ